MAKAPAMKPPKNQSPPLLEFGLDLDLGAARCL
jgi:hypothetical protein